MSLALGLFLFHLAVSYAAPAPINTINVILGIAVLTLVYSGRTTVLWYVVVSYMLLDLWAGNPVGSLTLAATIAILFAIWTKRTVFTSGKWYTPIPLALVAVVILRAMQVTQLFVQSLLSTVEIASYLAFFSRTRSEMLFTVLFVSTIHLSKIAVQAYINHRRRFSKIS